MKNINQNFLLILVSQIFNTFAGILFNVAIISYVYETTSSVAGSTLVLVISTIATIVGGFIAGNVLDKIQHKKVMFLSDVFCSITILGLAITVSYIGLNVYLIYTTTFIINLISSFFLPARSAIVPTIVNKIDLVRANGLLVSTIQIVLTAGWVIAVPILSIFGMPLIIYIICLGYLFSGLLIKYLNVEHDVAIEDSTSSFFLQFIKGVTPIWNNKVVRSITIMDALETFANIIWVPTFLLSFTIEILNSSEEWWGFQGAAYFLGLIIGGFLSAKYSNKLRLLGGKVLIFSSFSVAFITFAYGLNSIAVLAVVFSLLVGMPYQMRNVLQESLIQEHTNQAVLGRVFAARRVILQVFYALALILGSLLADKIGVAQVFIIGGVIYTLVAIYAISSPTIRKFNLTKIDKVGDKN